MSDSLHMVLPQFPDFYFEGEPAFHGQSKILNVSPWLKTQLGSRTKRVKSKGVETVYAGRLHNDLFIKDWWIVLYKNRHVAYQWCSEI